MAFDLDGANGNVAHGDVTQLNASTAMTLMLWANPDSVGTESRVLAMKGNGLQDYLYQAVQSSLGSFRVALGTGAAEPYAEYAGGISTGEWHHYAFTFQGGNATANDRVILYRDGSTVATTYNGTFSTAMQSTASPFVIGMRGNGVNYFDGKIAVVKAWSVTLSAAEVLAETWSYRPSRTDGLLVYPDYESTLALDYSGNGYHGTVSAGVSVTGNPIGRGMPILMY